MLCLTRAVDELIVIIAPGGQRLEIKLTKIDRNKVRIGFECPKDYKIYRAELLREDGSPTWAGA